MFFKIHLSLLLAPNVKLRNAVEFKGSGDIRIIKIKILEEAHATTLANIEVIEKEGIDVTACLVGPYGELSDVE